LTPFFGNTLSKNTKFRSKKGVKKGVKKGSKNAQNGHFWPLFQTFFLIFKKRLFSQFRRSVFLTFVKKSTHFFGFFPVFFRFLINFLNILIDKSVCFDQKTWPKVGKPVFFNFEKNRFFYIFFEGGSPLFSRSRDSWESPKNQGFLEKARKNISKKYCFYVLKTLKKMVFFKKTSFFTVVPI